jgi:hypothetical protein
LILPKWIEAAQKRTIKRNRRPLMSWDIARFGDDDNVGMRRACGGWVPSTERTTRADTMVTTGHITKAHMEISAEKGLNDSRPSWSTWWVSVPVSTTAWLSSAYP